MPAFPIDQKDNDKGVMNDNSGVAAGGNANIERMNAVRNDIYIRLGSQSGQFSDSSRSRRTVSEQEEDHQHMSENESGYVAVIQQQLKEIQWLRSRVAEKKMHLASAQARVKLVEQESEEKKVVYEKLVEKEKQEKATLQVELTEEGCRQREYEAKAEQDRKELGVAMEEHRVLLQTLQDENSTLRLQLMEEARRREESDSKAESDRKDFEVAVEKERVRLVGENSKLLSELKEEQRCRRESESRVERDQKEFKAAIEEQHIHLVRMQEQNKVLEQDCKELETRLVKERQALLGEVEENQMEMEEQKKKFSMLRSELSEEVRRRNDLETRVEEECDELVDTFEKEHRALLERIQVQMSDRRGRRTEFKKREERERDGLLAGFERKRRVIFERIQQQGTVCDKLIEEQQQTVNAWMSRMGCTIVPRRPDVMVMVMGPPGVGKSSLIQLIMGGENRYSIEAETSDIRLAHFFEPDGRCVTFVDTPVFGIYREGETEDVILQRIAAFLENE